MTFLFNTKDKAFIWASPEKHLKIENKEVTMNPIAGTMIKWDFNNFYENLIKFTENDKEINELFMVLDEELKMMLIISENWNIEWPSFKDCWAVIHSEYELVWWLRKLYSVLGALKETLYAPTLVWWPLESAFKLIKKYEWDSREYYGWAFGILDENFLDTAIVIRTATIDKINNNLSVRAWAWIVKNSEAEYETNETIKKSQWFLNTIINPKANENYIDKLNIEELNLAKKKLEIRNEKLSEFYLNNNLFDDYKIEKIIWKDFKLIANWDNFVYMLWFMIEKMWWIVEIIENINFDINEVNENDIILLWPGYWNINDRQDNRMIKLLEITKKLIANNSKLLWICLWHQAICKIKGAEILKQKESTQWIQRNWKWFYNSFSPDFWSGMELNYSFDSIESVQHHPESVMSIKWFEELKNMILEVVK